jgi:TolB-like protein/DNA-binding winged helix-turn-helix (wHTH) protein/Flp pilus assembly protein TadD
MDDLVHPTTSARIDLANERDFDIGNIRIRPAELAVIANDERHELQPRVMQVLVALAQARPSVVSRDKLIEQCWEGRIVGDDALNRCILALRHLAQEITPQPFAIETVARVGHRLIENGAEREAAPQTSRSGRWRLAAAALVLFLVATAGLVFWQQRGIASESASIAVLPFRNLSSGEPYFAEGVGEEIMGQLAREPAFRVAGSASAAQFSGPADPRKIGRALNVDYILEGSVRPDADRVRINAALIQTKDGVRLWSETYDRKLDDILEVQGAIGQAVASELRRALVHSSAARVRVNGKAYALYLNARGILRSGNPESGRDAVDLLREVIRLDPTFAPAWSSLAQALMLDGSTKGDEGLVAVLPQARDAVGRSLRLDPNDPDAHAILSILLGSDGPEAIAHQLRAAALDPTSGEGLLRLGLSHQASGEWAEATAAFSRAHKLDPVWSDPVRVMLDHVAQLGDRRAAEAVINEGMTDDPMIRQFALARVARLVGDFSEGARGWSALAEGQTRWASPSKLSLQDTLFMLNLSKDRPSRPARPFVGQARVIPARIWITAPPSSAEWQKRNRSWAAELVYRDQNVIAAKLMLRAGRARELAATFDTPTGLLGVRHGQALGTCYLQSAAIVAAALRDVGRRPEADALLREADGLIRRAYARGRVPLWFEDDAAGVWALQGKRAAAVAALERALRRGSVHATRTDLLKLEDEPALLSLRGDPGFEAVRSKYEAHFARERQETARALKIAV